MYLAVCFVHLSLAGLHRLEVIVILVIALIVGSFILTQEELESCHHDARVGVEHSARCDTNGRHTLQLNANVELW